MKIGTDEYNNMIKSFEKGVIEGYLNVPANFTKESEDMAKNGYIYCNGETNNAFRAFQFGYSCGRINYLN